MNFRKLSSLLLLLTIHNMCQAQLSLVNFPDSFKTSSKYYSPNHKPVSKPAVWGILSAGQPFDSLQCWPSSPLYNPDRALLQQLKKPGRQGVVILVDTQQTVDCNEYIYWLKKDKKYYPDAKVGYIEHGKRHFFDATETSQVVFAGYPVYIVNLSDTTLKLRHRKYSVPLVQEALDMNGHWKPIETLFSLPPGIVVTNYSALNFLRPGEMMVSGIYRYMGRYRTILRVKIEIDGKTYYSEPFQGSVNPSQITSKKTYKFN